MYRPPPRVTGFSARSWENEFLSKLQQKRELEQAELIGFHFIKTLSFVVAVIAPVFLGVAVRCEQDLTHEFCNPCTCNSSLS